MGGNPGRWPLSQGDGVSAADTESLCCAGLDDSKVSLSPGFPKVTAAAALTWSLVGLWVAEGSVPVVSAVSLSARSIRPAAPGI